MTKDVSRLRSVQYLVICKACSNSWGQNRLRGAQEGDASWISAWCTQSMYANGAETIQERSDIKIEELG